MEPVSSFGLNGCCSKGKVPIVKQAVKVITTTWDDRLKGEKDTVVGGSVGGGMGEFRAGWLGVVVEFSVVVGY